jgi:hypothetical protein
MIDYVGKYCICGRTELILERVGHRS